MNSQYLQKDIEYWETFVPKITIRQHTNKIQYDWSQETDP